MKKTYTLTDEAMKTLLATDAFRTLPEDQASALLLAGFTNEAGRFVYTQENGEGERSQ